MKGNLRDFSPTQILNLVSLAHKSGTLGVEHKDGRAMLSFKEGKLIFASVGDAEGSLASILALEPRILVLDEPTSDLDPAGRRELLDAIRSLRQTGNLTLLMIDPETDEMGWADRLIVLDAGRIASAGSNDPQLAALYKDKFVLEDQINQLRAKKKSMTPDAYDDALEDLLVQLARKAKTIRELEGRKS